MSTISVDTLRKEFSSRGNSVTAVDGVDLDIEDGEFVTLVGPSGCGKTTMLRLIAGLEHPTNGTIDFNGTDVTDVPANKRNLAMMFQNIALYPHMTVRANIAYPLKVGGVPKEERQSEAATAAEVMQIPELLEKYPGELSGGQRQRAALARTLVQDPVAFLMDEPLSDLDAKLKVDIRKEIQRVHKQLEKPTIYVTHDQEEALTMSDRIAVTNDGKIEQIGTRKEVYENPVNAFVANFIGNPSINFFDVAVEFRTAEAATIQLGDQVFDIETKAVHGDPGDGPMTLGVRPQDIRLGNEPSRLFDATVTLLEPIDDRMLVTLEGGPDGEFRAMVPTNDSRLAEEQTTTVSIEHASLYLFDQETGDLIAKGTT